MVYEAKPNKICVMKMLLNELLSGLRTKKRECTCNILIENIACRLEDVKQNTLFFCFCGTNTDSHKLAAEAMELGAVAFIAERAIDVPSYAIVANARKAMSLISKKFYGGYVDKMKIISVVGTNGKTTTTYIITHILNKLKKNVAVIGTCGVSFGDKFIDTGMTTPDPIELHRLFAEMFNSGVEYVVMEVSAHAIFLDKMQGITAEVAVFTNFSQDHLDFFKNMKRYRAVKRSYFCHKYIKSCVINIDDNLGMEIFKNAKCEKYGYSLKKYTDFSAMNYINTYNGIEYILSTKAKLETVRCNLSGQFNVYNTLGGIAALCSLGFSLERCALALKSFKGVDGRFERINLKNGACAVIDYAHTEDGMRNVLLAARNIFSGNLITVFGCGGNRDKSKRQRMGAVASELSDFVVITSDNPRFEQPQGIIAEIETGVSGNYIAIVDRKDAIIHALSAAKPGDAVMLLGKGHEQYMDICGEKLHFSDREVVNEYMGQSELAD